MLPLEDIKVVDFSRFLPAAYASWICADMGAHVIRIEHPRELAKQEAMFGSTNDAAAALRTRARPSFFRNKRKGLIKKTVVFFLGRTKARAATISHEHVGAEYLPYEMALGRLMYTNAKEALRAAKAFLDAAAR